MMQMIFLHIAGPALRLAWCCMFTMSMLVLVNAQSKEQYISQESDIIWGEELNGLRSGVWSPQGRILVRNGQTTDFVELVVGNVAEERRIYFRPRREQLFRLRMVKVESGREPLRTANAKSIGKDLEVGLRVHEARRKYIPVSIDPGKTSPLSNSIDPAEYFQLDNPGIYELYVFQRIYVEENNVLKPVVLPVVKIRIQVEDDGDGLGGESESEHQ